METPEALLSEHRAILLDQIRPSPSEPQAMRRKAFDKEELQELAESIKTLGLANPILVRPVPTTGKDPGHYEIVAGERRYLAHKLAGLERIDCTVRHLGDREVLELQLVENLQREGLHPMHEAEAYHELKTVYGKHPNEIADEIGKSRTYVYNALKLLELSPKAKKAFYANEISRSIAEKLARIPPKLQDEALPEILGGRWDSPMSYREAVEHINKNYMLDLASAPFPTDDAELNNAGPCGVCPKRTGNQPELFADVKKGDTCTDSLCFAAKARAFGQRQAATARADGRVVIDGKKAKQISPYRGNSSLTGGYHTLDDEVYVGNGWKKAKTLLKPGEQPAILIDPHGSGRAIEVVNKSQLVIPKSAESTYRSQESQQRKKVERENKLRRAVWAQLRPKLGKPTDLELARAAYNALDSELQKVVWQSRDVELKKSKHGVFDRDHHEREIAKLKGAELVSFMNDCLWAPSLRANSWITTDKSGAKLFAKAKEHKINIAAIKRELAPKKKPAKKKAKAARRRK